MAAWSGLLWMVSLAACAADLPDAVADAIRALNDNGVAPITLEMLAKAREIADTVEVFTGGDGAALAETVGAHGATWVPSGSARAPDAIASTTSTTTTITRVSSAVRVMPKRFTVASATTATIATGRSHPAGAA